ncbi:hypothetical protein ACG83_30695 [Frankia sp. R43]|uniref:Zn-ribbon domain-containing OB-fold protein n=1 Tax=Frankia sp. R43 TaxID=269536 RepID=UPI0006CA1E08|nr:OB-fold domain-containing protein [Frankia sp. R43]KPM51948.1 hypothetical protein ACG83_30695 [Frankia sp. R43]
MTMGDTEPTPRKPIPVPDILSQPFWDSADRGQLAIQRCADCERYFHPPVPLCFRCGSVALRYAQVSGRGRVYTFTVTRQARNPAFARLEPYVVAWVELEEQDNIRLICNMPSDDLGRVSIGAAVEVYFEPNGMGRKLPQFRLVSEVLSGGGSCA